MQIEKQNVLLFYRNQVSLLQLTFEDFDYVVTFCCGIGQYNVICLSASQKNTFFYYKNAKKGKKEAKWKK